MMADNGVKPHTTVTVTTQSGLAPQVCFTPILIARFFRSVSAKSDV